MKKPLLKISGRKGEAPPHGNIKERRMDTLRSRQVSFYGYGKICLLSGCLRFIELAKKKVQTMVIKLDGLFFQ